MRKFPHKEDKGGLLDYVKQESVPAINRRAESGLIMGENIGFPQQISPFPPCGGKGLGVRGEIAHAS